MKIIINRCYGGYGLSHEAIMRYTERTSVQLLVIPHETLKFIYYLKPENQPTEAQLNDSKWIRDNLTYFGDFDIARTDPVLVSIVEELGSKKASGRYAKLKVVEVPDDIEWTIDEYDGIESVHEIHRVWN